MKTKFGSIVLGCICGAAAMAHHGISVSYQLDKTITISGTVTEFSFSNPHPEMFLDAKNPLGSIDHWTTEWITSPGRLQRVSGGWNRNTIKPGDKAIVVCNPLRVSGKSNCLLRELTINGEKMKLGEDASKD
ncbi:MAG: DUF6152 family protein [Bryobacteraceae bacterium]